MSALHVHLRAARTRAGLTATALADTVGLSRQAYAAVEAGRAIPGTDTALRLARALGTPVEALFGLGGAGPLPPVAPSCVVRVGERDVELPLGAPHGLPGGGGEGRPTVVLAGCDPGTAILVARLAERHGVHLLWVESGSTASLGRLARGEVHVAGSHLPDTAARVAAAGLDAEVVHLAVWEQGLVVAPGNPLALAGAEDLARPGVRLVNRETGSGSRRLLDERLAVAGVVGERLPGYRTAARGHLAVAEAVASGLADAGVATAAAARAFGLSFSPWEHEAYRLVVPRRFLALPVVASLLDVLRAPAVRADYERLGGYDLQHIGTAA